MTPNTADENKGMTEKWGTEKLLTGLRRPYRYRSRENYFSVPNVSVKYSSIHSSSAAARILWSAELIPTASRAECHSHLIRGALILLFAAVTSLLHPAATKSDDAVVTVVTLGDSITKGVRSGVKPEETFAFLVEAGLKKQGMAARVINVGIGGERTDQALVRLDKEVLSLKPRIVTIMYGTNDSFVDKGKQEPRLTAQEFRDNLVAIVTRLRGAGVIPVLMTEPRWGAEGRNGLDENPNDLLEKYVAECRSVAKDHKLPLVDHFAHWTKAEADGMKIADWTTDQCHPNPAGHKVMAELMLPVIEKALQAETRKSE